eukprot:NODE_451_length_7265_cov_0.799609.p4 type:complete len:321 gc:universal NODE_451_length_7265_cov_0.799609:2894-1932(-)
MIFLMKSQIHSHQGILKIKNIFQNTPNKMNYLILSIGIYLASFIIPQLSIFYTLHYPNPSNTKYTSGKNDLFVVFYFSMIWLSIRQILLKIPMNFKKQQRFKEQLYQAFMYLTTFAFGVYNYLNSDFKDDWSLVIQNMPHHYVDFNVKLYYLLILSMWIQMVYVLFNEKQRKDHLMMVFHHFITISLVSMSWFLHLNKIGLLIEMIFDSTDIFLCIAKCMKYLKLNTLADVLFGCFVVNWGYTRTWLYLQVIIIFSKFGKYNENGRYLNTQIYYFLLGLLIALYVLVLIWSVMILKLVLKVLKGNNVDDSRSDEEDEKQD